ncbi:MAG: YaaA family protein [Planctomycetaceae bacterium]
MPARPPLILVPPSEGKAPGGDGPAWRPGSMAVDLDRRRAKALVELRRAMREDEPSRARLLGVKGTALAAATRANLSAGTSPTLPAIERYTGVLYDALDARSLGAVDRRRLDASVVIVSGLWGLVAPGDPIPDYKLKMGARLGRLGVLSAWWRDDLTERLASLAAGRRVWNLLPNEHAAAWRPRSTLPQWSVRFLDHAPDGSLVAVSHRNKALKGALVRFLATHPSAGPADLAAWDHPDGYRLRTALTEQRDATTVLSLVREA